MKVELTKEQIQDLLFIIDNSTFKGANAEKIVELKKRLREANDTKGRIA